MGYLKALDLKMKTHANLWRRLWVFCLGLLTIALAHAQSDSLRYFNPSHRVELGINATATLSTFVGNETVGISPADYPLSIKFMQGSKAAWRLGLGVETSIEQSDGTGLGIITENELINFYGRAGFEWRKILSQRWMFFAGLDALFSVGRDNGRSDTQIGATELNIDRWALGGGPVYGIQFAINPRLHVGTEGNIYLTLVHTVREEIFEFDPQLNNSRTTDVWDLRTNVPQWLYLTLRL